MVKQEVAKHIRTIIISILKKNSVINIYYKYYTRMAGIESKLGDEVYISDDTEGIIPRAFRFLWFSFLLLIILF